MIFSKPAKTIQQRTMCHSVDPFPLKTLGDRSGKNEVPHRSPPYWRYFVQKKAGDLFVHINSQFTTVQSNNFLQNNAEFLPLPSEKRDQFLAFLLQLIFPTPSIRKNTLETFLFDQRPRQRLRQRLRRVSKASASRQPGRRRC